ncbi:MAG: type II secretion system F family protein [Patescibacteria group bacterium]|nr:type II secretion system F family protein [Patescibacteria group bacterium]
MIFHYQISDSQGKISQGTIEAASAKEARNRLALQPGTLISLKMAGEKKKAGGIIIGRVRLVEKVMLAQHLSVMIKAGMTIDAALETLADNSSSVLNKRLNEVLVDVRKGHSLSAALAKHPKDFDKMFINMVAVGEEGGTLAKNLAIVASQQKKSYELRSKLKAASMYPTVVLLAVIALGALISAYVLPKIIGFFDSLNVTLPLTTRMMIVISRFMAENWLAVLGVIFGIFVAWQILLKFKNSRYFIHSFILRLPILGKLDRQMNLALFCRTIASLLDSGISIDRALQIVSQTLGNEVYKREVILVYHKILKGMSLADALAGRSYFPSLVSRMTRVGENSGQLSETLDYLADFYENEVDVITKNLSTMLEPVLLVIIGLSVAFAAMSIINPIYNLTGELGR